MTFPEIGELVFAKVRGHSPWPAVVLSKLNGNKYKVYFNDTDQTAAVKKDVIFPFKESEEEYERKYKKHKKFMNALKLVREMELQNPDNESDKEDDPPLAPVEAPPPQQIEVGQPPRYPAAVQPPQQGEERPPGAQEAPRPQHQESQEDREQLLPVNVGRARGRHGEDKIEIKVKIKMTPEQFKGLGLPGLLATANAYH